MAKIKSKTAGEGGKAAAKNAGKKPGWVVKALPSATAPTDALSPTEAPLAAASLTNDAENAGTPRAGSKLAIVLGMLREDGGVSIAAIMQATGWLSHTTRAVLTGLKKRGFVIERQAGEKDSPSVYRIRAGGNDQADAPVSSSASVTKISSGRRAAKRAA
ncbi:MAG: DUF3489 domain-containing protein [Beijerinckiaceae bacterium]